MSKLKCGLCKWKSFPRANLERVQQHSFLGSFSAPTHNRNLSSHSRDDDDDDGSVCGGLSRTLNITQKMRNSNAEACWIRINKNYRSICIFVNRITQKTEKESKIRPPSTLSRSLFLSPHDV